MENDKYTAIANSTFTFFEFESIGPKGTIKKAVAYQRRTKDIYNLAFGDRVNQTQQIDDLQRSNNGDRDKVLATVASTIFTFLQYHTTAEIVFKGSSTSRTRLYQIALINNLKELTSSIYVQGYFNGTWTEFSGGKNYEVFSIRLK